MSHDNRERRWTQHWRALCALLPILCGTAFGLDRDRTLAQFQHTAWTVSDGVPSSIVALAQTADGYLWLGTYSGLIRFDGIRFEPYYPPRGNTFPSNEVFALLATPDGGLWIGFLTGGVSFLKQGRVVNYGERDGIPSGGVRSLARDTEGAIWAGTTHGLRRFADSRWQTIGSDWDFPAETAVYDLFADRNGNLWATSDDGLFCLPKGGRTFQRRGLGVRGGVVQTSDGTLWLADYDKGVHRISGPEERPQPPKPSIEAHPSDLFTDRDGGLWIEDGANGVARVPNPERLTGNRIAFNSSLIEHFKAKDGLSSNHTHTGLEDREGNIWIATGGGLDRFRRRNFVPGPFTPTHFALLADQEGAIWAGGVQDARIMRLRDNKLSFLNPIGLVTCAYRDADGVLWFGGQGSLRRFARNRFEKVALPPGIEGGLSQVQAITADHNGGLWVSLVRNGVFRLRKGKWSPSGDLQGLPKAIALTLWTDPRGRVWFGWFGSHGNSVSVLDGDIVKTFSAADGLQVGDVTAISGTGGHVWVGGQSGLALFDGNKFRMLATAAVGEPADILGITAILETENGGLWLDQTNGMVVHIPRAEIESKLKDEQHLLRYEVFDHSDGVQGGAAPLRPFPSAILAKDGRIWISRSTGAFWIDPAHIYKNRFPPVVSIQSVLVDGQAHSASEVLDLPVLPRNVEIDYVGLSLSVPERVGFRYQLQGFDKGWQVAGTRRSAFYTNLRPGRYRFRVIACNEAGVWNETGAAWEFNVPPAFYQTNWFLLLCVTAVGWSASAGYQWRVRQVAARLDLQFRERLAERTRVAQDLHDTLLQGFLSASLQLQVADAHLAEGSPAAAKPIVGEVLVLIRSIIEEGRKTVRGLRSWHEETRDLTQAFSRIPQELCSQQQVDYRVTVEGRPRPLHPVVRDDVYRIAREAVVNAFRHSQARGIEVELKYGTDQLQILVCDDGCGIDPQVLRSGREGHWGLSGMRERAERIGARLKVWSRPAGGTEVELSVPGAVAFRPYSPGRLGWVAKLHRRKAEPGVPPQTSEREV